MIPTCVPSLIANDGYEKLAAMLGVNLVISAGVFS